jgi:hypothetical protein
MTDGGERRSRTSTHGASLCFQNSDEHRLMTLSSQTRWMADDVGIEPSPQWEPSAFQAAMPTTATASSSTRIMATMISLVVGGGGIEPHAQRDLIYSQTQDHPALWAPPVKSGDGHAVSGREPPPGTGAGRTKRACRIHAVRRAGCHGAGVWCSSQRPWSSLTTMVHERRFELLRVSSHWLLEPACLPVPSFVHWCPRQESNLHGCHPTGF